MRRELENSLYKLAREEDVILLLGDLGSFPTFQERYPDKVINVGCMESNMVNFAVGLASEGYKVVIYTVSGFTLYKAYDQIKFIVPEIKNAGGSITIFNAGPGFVYNAVGRGHYLLSDLALIEQEANVFMPKCKLEVREALDSIKDEGSFNYIRGGADGAPLRTHNMGFDYSIGTVVTTGTTFDRVLEIVLENDIRCDVESLYNSLPDGKENLTVIEDHQQNGGVNTILNSEGYETVGHMYTPHHIALAHTDREKVWEAAGLGKERIKDFLIKNYGQADPDQV